MSVELDLDRSAASLVALYGNLASLNAGQRAFHCLAHSDRSGYEFWLKARGEIDRLLDRRREARPIPRRR